MVRENLENQEEERRETRGRGFEANRDVELTPADRRNIRSLISELRGGSDLDFHERALDNTDSSELIELRNRLRNENGKAVRAIFELIKEDADANRQAENISLEAAERRSLFRHSPLLMLAASKSDSFVFSELLASPIILGDSDRSNRSRLFEILWRIAGPESIEHTKTFVEKSFTAPYSNVRKDLVFYDILDAFKTFETILIRDGDETEPLTYDEKQEVMGAEEHIKRQLAVNNYPPIVQEDIDKFKRRYEREKREYENYFIQEPPRFINLEQPFLREPIPPYEDAWIGAERDRSMRDDIRQDRELRSAYDEQHFYKIESRLEIVKRLRHEAKKEKAIKDKPEDDDTKFLRRHWLELREEKPSPLAPTLGIEIEIRESAAGVPKELRWPGPDYNSPERDSWLKEKDKFLQQAQKPYLKTSELGVPYAFDKFWEFAHKPVRYYHTLSREVQALMEMNLIDREDQKHPLHLTIGGITSEGDTGEEPIF